eukprot:8803740-Pyramimonas_sp.AAC.1
MAWRRRARQSVACHSMACHCTTKHCNAKHSIAQRRRTQHRTACHGMVPVPWRVSGSFSRGLGQSEVVHHV